MTKTAPMELPAAVAELSPKLFAGEPVTDAPWAAARAREEPESVELEVAAQRATEERQPARDARVERPLDELATLKVDTPKEILSRWPTSKRRSPASSN